MIFNEFIYFLYFPYLLFIVFCDDFFDWQCRWTAAGRSPAAGAAARSINLIIFNELNIHIIFISNEFIKLLVFSWSGLGLEFLMRFGRSCVIVALLAGRIHWPLLIGCGGSCFRRFLVVWRTGARKLMRMQMKKSFFKIMYLHQHLCEFQFADHLFNIF